MTHSASPPPNAPPPDAPPQNVGSPAAFDRRAAPEICDALILGAGPAGLTLALLLANQGRRVVIVDPVEPGRRADARSAALLEPSLALLERAGVWPQLAPAGAELRRMRLIDAGRAGDRPGARGDVQFDANEIGRPAFGVNIGNEALKMGLFAAASAHPRISVRAPARLAHLVRREDAALAQIDPGGGLRAAVVVGADGRRSQLRADLGVGVREVRLRQTAMAFQVAHAPPHEHVSTEILQEGGPFTLVPAPDGPDGRPRSNVVWMTRERAAEQLMALDEAAFSKAATARSLEVLGALTLASPRLAYPVTTQLADRFIGRRAALIAEAAHVAPPIGAQGLNISLADAAALADLIAEAGERDVGALALLERYERARWPDAAARLAAVTALSGAALGALAPIRDARLAALSALGAAGPLKRAAMRFGMGG